MGKRRTGGKTGLNTNLTEDSKQKDKMGVMNVHQLKVLEMMKKKSVKHNKDLKRKIKASPETPSVLDNSDLRVLRSSKAIAEKKKSEENDSEKRKRNIDPKVNQTQIKNITSKKYTEEYHNSNIVKENVVNEKMNNRIQPAINETKNKSSMIEVKPIASKSQTPNRKPAKNLAEQRITRIRRSLEIERSMKSNATCSLGESSLSNTKKVVDIATKKYVIPKKLSIVPNIKKCINKSFDESKKRSECSDDNDLKRRHSDGSSLKRKRESLENRDKVNLAEERLHKLRESLLENINDVTVRRNESKSTEAPVIDEDMETNSPDKYEDIKANDSCLIEKQEESMDWESIQCEIKEIKCLLTSEKIEDYRTKKVDSNIIHVQIVVDTNILLRSLSLIETIINGNKKYVQITIPWVVFNELDGLKSFKSQESDQYIHKQARIAVRFLHNNLKKSFLCGQSLSMANQHLFPCHGGDDEILNCCLQLVNNYNVILLSDDINLCNKALVNHVTASTSDEFIDKYWKQLDVKFQSKETHNSGVPDEKFDIVAKCDLKFLYEEVEKYLLEDLSTILKIELKNKFHDVWSYIVLYKPPWSMRNLLKCFIKHWVPVFGDTLPASGIHTFTNLLKDLDGLLNLNSELFDTIIKHSMDILKLFLSTSHKNLVSKTMKSLEEILSKYKSSCGGTCQDVKESGCESHPRIINIFKCILDTFGEFCYYLAVNLDIPHGLNIKKDKILSMDILLLQTDAVGNQLQAILACLLKVLTIQDDNVAIPLQSLFNILTDTVQGIGNIHTVFTIDDLTAAFLHKKNIFEDSYNGFLILHSLMLKCSDKYASMQNNK